MAIRPATAPHALSDRFDRLAGQMAIWSPSATALALWRFFLPAGLSPAQRLWRLLWLPFWAWSDTPAPVLRVYLPATSDGTAAGDRLLAVLRSLARRHGILRGIGVLFRAVSLACLMGGVWALIDSLGGRQVDSRALFLSALAILTAGIVLAVAGRPRPHDIARMLDRSFALNDRVATGFEQVVNRAASGRPRALDRLQIVDATNTAAALAPRQPVRSLLPVREVVLAVACALLMAALLLMRGTGAGMPELRTPAVPSFVSAQDRITQQANVPGADDQTAAEMPSVEEVQEQADRSAAAQQDLLALADALDDNPLSKPVADAIRAGEYDQAAAELAEVAAELETLSPQARADLADRLDEAAERMSGEHPELTEQVEETAESLRTGENTEESATDLSEEIEQTGDAVIPQEQLAEDMRDARTSDSPADGERTGETQPEAGNEGQPADGQPEEASGEGQDASGGQGDESQDGSDSGSGQGSGDENSLGGQPGEGGEQSGGAQGEQPGGDGGQSMGGSEGSESDPSGEGGQGQTDGGQAESGQTVPQQGTSGEGSNQNAQEGAGSGSGEGEDVDGRRQTSNSSESRPGTGSDGEPEPNLTEADAGAGTSGQTEVDPSTSITLPRSPDETGYQAGGTSGSSSSGSGQGVAAGTGSVEQDEVGSAGPDANRVPDEYRSTVEEYFSGDP